MSEMPEKTSVATSNEPLEQSIAMETRGDDGVGDSDGATVGDNVPGPDPNDAAPIDRSEAGGAPPGTPDTSAAPEPTVSS